MNEVKDRPKLIISVYGGRKYFTMNENIEKEFMESMAEAAITPGKTKHYIYIESGFANEDLIRNMGYHIRSQ